MDFPSLRLSQAQLNLFSTCPRKFQHIYLEQSVTPVPLGQQERARWGNQFHLLMQQRELALPVGPLLQAEPQLEETVQRLQRVAPELFASQPGTWRAAEHSRSLTIAGFWLTAVYDLLVAEPQQAQIIDWKTYWRSRPRPELARDWQTRLYLFLLAETSDYAPEQLRLTYWFVQVSPQPQAITFTYDRAQHEQTRQDLQNLLSDLKTAITDYQAGESLTQVPLSAGQCDRCPFARRCDRAGDAPTAETQDWQAAIATIDEVPL
ncbi:MAG: PD-(D/E)XK nuclease family protein [Spirulinaceae cyanobacterium SM2_1_0]|nr:PD-(D/E)XK nuclease family protein [Spirulinaceae cyanobacterium SM2_1_0]